MVVQIHKVLSENAYDYTVCHIACWQAAYRDIIPEDYLTNMTNEIEDRVDRLTKNLNELSDEFQYYYAELENKMIGRLIIGRCRDEDKPNAGEIGAIYLLEEYWNRGFGRQLMNYAIKNLKAQGYNDISLWVLEENHRARRFYEKSGFIFDGTKKEINIGKPLVEMRYTLRDSDMN